MQRELRLILLVVILVAGPTAILTFLAAGTLRSWDVVLERHLALAAERELRAIASDLRGDLSAIVAQARQALGPAGTAAEAWTDTAAELCASNSLVAQLYLYRPSDGAWVYPPVEETDPLSGSGSSPLEEEWRRALQEAQQLQFSEGSPGAAAAYYEAILARPDLPPVMRCEALMGQAQAHRGAGRPAQAIESLQRLIAGCSPDTDVRDGEGYLYVLRAEREIIILQEGMAQWTEAFESALDLWRRLGLHRPAVVPYQFQSLESFLRERTPSLLDRLPTREREVARERVQQARDRLREREKGRQFNRGARDTLAAIVRRELASGLGSGDLRGVEAGGGRIIVARVDVPRAPAGTEPSSNQTGGVEEYVVGIRVDPERLAERLDSILRRAARWKGFRLAVSAYPRDLQRPGAVRLVLPPGRRLVELGVSSPLDGIRLGAWPIDPAGAPSGATMQRRLYLWGIVLLAAVVGVGAWIAIGQAMAEIRRARVRSDFVAGVSHDLRTPLSSMRMLAESLSLDNIRDEPTRKKFLAAILKECDRLGQLTERALYFIRLGQGTLQFRLVPNDVGGLAEEVGGMFRARFRDGDVDVQVSVEDDLPLVSVDASALAQVLFNLLENAAKYSPGRPVVRMEVRRTDGGKAVAISVRDYGIGIPKKDRHRIFRRFTRGRDPRVTGVSGAGLGLALCRHIVAAHHGTIGVISPLEGGGSLFRVVLPAVEE